MLRPFSLDKLEKFRKRFPDVVHCWNGRIFDRKLFVSLVRLKKDLTFFNYEIKTPTHYVIVSSKGYEGSTSVSESIFLDLGDCFKVSPDEYGRLIVCRVVILLNRESLKQKYKESRGKLIIDWDGLLKASQKKLFSKYCL